MEYIAGFGTIGVMLLGLIIAFAVTWGGIKQELKHHRKEIEQLRNNNAVTQRIESHLVKLNGSIQKAAENAERAYNVSTKLEERLRGLEIRVGENL